MSLGPLVIAFSVSVLGLLGVYAFSLGNQLPFSFVAVSCGVFSLLGAR